MTKYNFIYQFKCLYQNEVEKYNITDAEIEWVETQLPIRVNGIRLIGVDLILYNRRNPS